MLIFHIMFLLTVCTDNGVEYKNGQTWKIDDCTPCICDVGKALCEVSTNVQRSENFNTLMNTSKYLLNVYLS